MRSPAIYFITGTDTGVGKTVLASLLVRRFRESEVAVAALKPLCSGGREDALALHRALGATLSLDQINPWHFEAPLAPAIAAEQEGRTVKLSEVLRHIRHVAARSPVTIVEGAGGLLSPLGSGFDSRDLIEKLNAIPILVGVNRLGVINQVLLARSALSTASASMMRVVLMASAQPDSSSPSNLSYLRNRLGKDCVHEAPRITRAALRGTTPLPTTLARMLDGMLG